MAASKQASKQASKHTHARAQCSNPSVGLAQTRPNNMHESINYACSCMLPECMCMTETGV